MTDLGRIEYAYEQTDCSRSGALEISALSYRANEIKTLVARMDDTVNPGS